MKYFSFILFIFFNLSCENDRTLFSINNVSYSDVEIFKYIEKDVFESLELTEKEIQLRTLAEDFIFMNEAKILGIDTLKSVQFLMKDKIQNRLLDSLLRQKVVRPMFSDSSLKNAYVQLKKTVGLNHLIINHRFSKGKAVERTKIKAMQLAEKVRTLIKSDSMSFERAVYRYCDDPLLKDEKGRLGYIHYGRMIPEVIEVAWDPNSPRFPKVIESDFGFHIIEILGSKQVQQGSFEKVKHEIHKMISLKRLPEAEFYFTRMEDLLIEKYQFKMINDAVDRLYKFVTPDKTSPTLGWVAQSNFPEVIGMIGDEEITVSWLKGRILANSPLRETVCYISFSLMEYTKDVIFRELGSRYARELGLIPKDELDRFERQVKFATLKDELFSQMLKQDSGLTMEILGNQLAFKNDIKIHLNQLN
jgi:hypothetical protein